MKLTKKEFEKILKDKVVSECGVTLDVASAEQIYRCMAMIVRQIMSDRQKQFQAKTLGEGKKQVDYSAWSSGWAAACAPACSTWA